MENLPKKAFFEIVTLFLTCIMCLSICACNNEIENQVEITNDIKTVADATGIYKSAGLFLKYECVLNENTTFDISGTNYLTKVFKKDTEYELKPTFDSNGRSNQSFKTGEGDQFNYSEGFALSLSEEGTYSAEHTIFSKVTMKYELEEHFEGTYKFENDILWLNYEGKDYPMLLINDRLYFDILEKVE